MRLKTLCKRGLWEGFTGGRGQAYRLAPTVLVSERGGVYALAAVHAVREVGK